jgi:CysZ protein
MRSVRDFLAGVGFFLQGMQWIARHGRWWLFGLIPAVIAFALYVGALVLLATGRPVARSMAASTSPVDVISRANDPSPPCSSA